MLEKEKSPTAYRTSWIFRHIKHEDTRKAYDIIWQQETDAGKVKYKNLSA